MSGDQTQMKDFVMVVPEERVLVDLRCYKLGSEGCAATIASMGRRS